MSNAPKPLPDLEFLNAMLTFDAVTGALFWKPRALSMFKDAKAHKDWASKYTGKRADHLYSNGYRRVRIKINGKDEIYGAHRVIWKMANGRDPVEEIDHIDRDQGNNALSNLREATRRENSLNRAFPTARQGTGNCVYLTRSGKFRAQLKIDGSLRYLGVFASVEAARQAVCAYRSARTLSQHETDEFECGVAAWTASFAA